MKSNLVAINIFDNDKLINKNGVPFLFYWDGLIDITSALQLDSNFNKYLSDNLLTTDKYGTGKIAYFYFIYNDETNEEVYNECFKPIQEWISIKDTNIPQDLIKTHFNYLYECSFKDSYKFENIFEADIIKIYDLIKTKYPQKIAKTTVINYVRSKLVSDNHLNAYNTNYIIDIIEKILIDKE